MLKEQGTKEREGTMKKKTIILMMVGIMSLSTTACSHSQHRYASSSDYVNTQDDDSELDSASSSETANETEENEINEPDPAEEAQKERERQESLIVYADMINEIQTDFPEFTIQYIVGTDDGGKDLSIHMPMLDSKDSTTYKMAELVTTKETLLNDNGITDISVFVMNGEDCQGIVVFSNENGSYEPTVNTL